MARESLDLDDLIASLDPGSARSSMGPSKPVPQRAVAAATMDDLDGLLMDLDSSRNSVAPSRNQGGGNYNQPSYSSQPAASSYKPPGSSAPSTKPSYSAIMGSSSPTAAPSRPSPASNQSNYGGNQSYGGSGAGSKPNYGGSGGNQSYGGSGGGNQPYGGNSNASARPSSAYGGSAQKGPLAGDALDDMLSGIMSGSGLNLAGPSSRGTCAQCRKPILGEVIQALGRTFHPEHFVCGSCSSPLGTLNFHENQGVPHCEQCYMNQFCSRCAHCNEPILERAMIAQGKKYHEGHFVCSQCLKPLSGGSYMEKDDRAYCDGCFHNAFLPRCAGCNESIRGEVTNALGQQWHPNHFCCQTCQKPFTGGQFYELAGRPFCETHYHQQKGSLCGGCGKAITGRSVDACNQKWHPEHLVCAYCTTQLAGSSFVENNGRVYCRDCNGKLFG